MFDRFLSRLDGLVTAARVKVYATVLLIGFLAAIVWTIGSATGGLNKDYEPIGEDFIAFYAASDLAREGRAADAYDLGAMRIAEQKAAPGSQALYPWHYPPIYFLFVAPLAWVPHLAALGLWVVATFAAYLLMIRRISRERWALVLAAAYPAVFLNAMHGQNGFLSAALMGLGLLLLEKRPIVAGVLIGLVAYKPQFGVLIPLLLLIQGRWRSIIAAGLTVCGLCALSYALYGEAPWIAFLENAPHVSGYLEQGQLPWANVPSVYVAVADLGMGSAVGYAVHGAVALVLGALTCLAWKRPGPHPLKVALAVPATLAISPYAFNYDLMLLAIPIAILADHMRRHAVAPGVKAVLVLAFLSPVAFTVLATYTPLHLMPVANILLFAAVWRTLRATAEVTPAEDAIAIPREISSAPPPSATTAAAAR